MSNFEYEIAGIVNVNRMLPQNGSWYYHYLKNGNIRIHGKSFDTDSFSPKKFEEKVITNGGHIVNNNILINKKPKKMSEPTTTTKDDKLIKIEQEIESFIEASSEKKIENTYSQLELISTNTIANSTTFAK